MGATNFIHKVEAHSAMEGFNALVSEAVSIYGDEPYNGTISTCDIGRQKLSFPKYSAKNEKEAFEYVENDDYGEKWYANYIDLGKTKDGTNIYVFYGWASE